MMDGTGYFCNIETNTIQKSINTCPIFFLTDYKDEDYEEEMLSIHDEFRMLKLVGCLVFFRKMMNLVPTRQVK